MESTKATLWLRVGDPRHQTLENQRAPLEAEAERPGFDVVKVYEIGESDFQGDINRELDQVYRDLAAQRFNTLLVWSLDRLSLQGIGPTFQILSRIERTGGRVLSVQDRFMNTDGPERELVMAVVSWVAQYESERRSERMKTSVERRRAEGKPLGRPKGSKDRRKRKPRGAAK